VADSGRMVHDVTTAALETEFPGWRVWRTTDARTWWASRRGPDWMREPRTLAADDAKGLRAELRDALTAAAGATAAPGARGSHG